MAVKLLLGNAFWKLQLPRIRQARACKAGVPKLELGNQRTLQKIVEKDLVKETYLVQDKMGSHGISQLV